MGTVVVPFMKLKTDEDYEKLVELGQKIIDFFAENALEHERTGEMIERIGLVNFLEGIGLDIDAEHGRRRRAPTPTSAPTAGTRKSPEDQRQEKLLPEEIEHECTRTPAAPLRTPIECGVPDNKPYLHPTLLKNYGNWKYHDRPRPGVLHHVSHSGDEVWTVRAGTQRQMDVYTIRKLCDIADTFAEGFVRFTIRSNIEFMVADPKKVAPLIAELTEGTASRSAAPAIRCR
jgi:dissimilatory sulfite reductase (desulfoviridin) alpha/beta subunit